MSDTADTAPTTEPATGEPETSTTDADTATPPDLSTALAEAEKWKKLAQKHEKRAKSNADAAKTLEETRRQAMTDQERAVAEAVDRVRAEMAGGLVAAEFKAAAATSGLDADALIEAVDPGKFLSEDGTPDVDAIQAFVSRITPEPAPQPDPGVPVFGDFGQGSGSANDQALNGDPLLRDLKAKLGAR
jgi:hypothetical protein